MSDGETADEHDLARGKAARNEQRKSLAATANAISVAVFVATVLQPFTLRSQDPRLLIGGIVLAVVLQYLVHYVLRHVED